MNIRHVAPFSKIFLVLIVVYSLPCLGQVRALGGPEDRIVINAGDSIRVAVFDTPELSLDHAQVGADGKVKLPLLGDVFVRGLSESEAAHIIDKAYQDGNFVVRPQSSVFILAFALNGISITGEVAKPGNYPVTGSRTLIDIIAMAGGLTNMANTRVTVQHLDGSVRSDVFLPLDNGPMTLKNNLSVSAGDKVVVERAGTIYVLGDVGKPGGYLMQYNGSISVLQAIAQASGTSRTSGENSAVLIRHVGESYTINPLRLRDMYKGKVSDVALNSGDVIYVPASNARNFVFNAPQILGSLAGAALYASAVTH